MGKTKNTAKSALEQKLTFMDDPAIKSADINNKYVAPPETGNVFNGYPFVGKVSDLKEDDPEHLRPQPSLIVYTKQLLTTVPDDLEEYNNIRQSCAMHKVDIFFEEKVYNAELKGWHILISWCDKIYIAPSQRRG